MSNDDTYKKGKKYLTSAKTYERTLSTKEGKKPTPIEVAFSKRSLQRIVP